MSFDLDFDDSVAIRTEFDEFPGEWFDIRPLTPDKVQHFITMTTKSRRVKGVMTDVRDDDRYSELLWDWVVEEWHLPKDPEGKILQPCTLENKVLLSKKSGQRANLIIEMAMEYANDDQKRKDAQVRQFRGVRQAAVGSSGSDVSGL